MFRRSGVLLPNSSVNRTVIPLRGLPAGYLKRYAPKKTTSQIEVMN